MRSSFAKSIYVGAAVLGLAGLSAVTTTTASAKSYATASSYTALTKGQNVLVNGTNAIYSKPGTVKGAKVVASKKTVAKLAASKKSSDTFYAYGTKTTNRGSVYYKIVTMDKKYRGYIYGGKTAGTFAGGIKTTDTLTDATVPTANTGFYLKDTKANTLWSAPKNTDINAKKVSLYGAKSSDTFTISKAATKTKEGSLYYYVTDDNNSDVAGWIYAGGLTTDGSEAFNQATQVQFNVKSLDGKTLKTFSYDVKTTAKNAAIGDGVIYDTAANPTTLTDGVVTAANNALKGTGYSIKGSDSVNLVSNAKSGDVISLYATKGDVVPTTITAYRFNGDVAGSEALVNSKTTAATGATAYKTITTMPTLTTVFSGAQGANYTSADVVANLTTNKATTLTSGDFYLPANTAADASAADLAKATLAKGTPNDTEYHMVYTLKSGVAGSYGQTPAQALYTGTLVKGAAPTTSTTGTTTGTWGN